MDWGWALCLPGPDILIAGFFFFFLMFKGGGGGECDKGSLEGIVMNRPGSTFSSSGWALR